MRRSSVILIGLAACAYEYTFGAWNLSRKIRSLAARNLEFRNKLTWICLIVANEVPPADLVRFTPEALLCIQNKLEAKSKPRPGKAARVRETRETRPTRRSSKSEKRSATPKNCSADSYIACTNPRRAAIAIASARPAAPSFSRIDLTWPFTVNSLI